MELLQLKYFKTVAELGKISEAAQALFVSPPALSTSISRLEKELEVPDFFFEELESQVLFQDVPVVMLHPDHPLAKRESVSLNMLRDQKIFLPFQDFPLHDHLIRLFDAANVPFPAGNAYSHLATQKMVAEGLGISFATRHSGKTPGEAVCYVPLQDATCSWIYRLFWRKSHRFTPDEQLFKGFLEEYYQVS